MNNRSLIFVASVLAFGLAGTFALAEDGVTKDRIVFGQIAALEGPAQALGQGMRQGLLAAFAEANRAGGVDGRKLELKSADDSYEPEKMIEAMKKMLGRRQSIRDRRYGRNPDGECRPADRDRGQSSFHRPFHGRRVPAQSV